MWQAWGGGGSHDTSPFPSSSEKVKVYECVLIAHTLIKLNIFALNTTVAVGKVNRACVVTHRCV